MKKLSHIESTMLPIPMSNIDTDQIMPKQFLKRVERSGYGEFLFYDWKVFTHLSVWQFLTKV